MIKKTKVASLVTSLLVRVKRKFTHNKYSKKNK